MAPLRYCLLVLALGSFRSLRGEGEGPLNPEDISPRERAADRTPNTEGSEGGTARLPAPRPNQPTPPQATPSAAGEGAAGPVHRSDGDDGNSVDGECLAEDQVYAHVRIHAP